MSQPPAPQPPAVPGGGGQPPAAAPTQIGFPGQVQLPPQPQYAPSPQQAQSLGGGAYAVGFPNYRSPAPSPPNRTSLIVGTIVVVLTVIFAVVGFLIVGGRGANSPEGAVQGFFTSVIDGDAGRAHDLLCDDLKGRLSERDLSNYDDANGDERAVGIEIDAVRATDFQGQPAESVDYTLTSDRGNQQSATAIVVEDKGWRVCDLGFTV